MRGLHSSHVTGDLQGRARCISCAGAAQLQSTQNYHSERVFNSSKTTDRMWSSLTHVISQATIYDWLLLASAILLLLYIAGTWNYDYFKQRGITADRPLLPFVGHTLTFLLSSESPPDMLMRLYNQDKTQGICGTFEFTNPMPVIKSPELLKIISVKEFDNFMNRRGFLSERADPLFGRNLFNLKDQRWRDMRTTLSPAFTTSKIKGMFPLVAQCAQQMAEHLKEKYQQNPAAKEKGLETDMKDLFSRMANDIIATVAFGLQCDSLKKPENEFYKNGKLLTNISFLRIWIFSLYIFLPKLVEALKLTFLHPKATAFFASLVLETIKQRKLQDIFRPDMLQLLMQAREGKLKAEHEDQHESENIGNRKLELTDEDVTSQAILFFFAGFETVSTGLCFTTYQLSHNPEVQERLQQEVDDVWERTDGKIGYEEVQGMKYLDAVINEALRMHPPVLALERQCQKDCTLPAVGSTPAVTVRKGQVVNLNVFGIHHDEQYWPDPQRFDPDRFSDENKHKIKPFTYMPFGLGPRICIGQRFALVEVKLALAYLIRNFNLTPSPKTKHPLEYTKSFNLTIKGGFWCYLSPRNVSN